MQVAISVVAAAMWMIEHPRRGVLRAGRFAARIRPGIARAVPGEVHLGAVRLDASEALQECVSRGSISPAIDRSDPWQFKNFLITARLIEAYSLIRSLHSGVRWSPKTAAKTGREHGTPLFVVDHDAIRRNYAQFKKYLPRVQAYYAVKANPIRRSSRRCTRPAPASTWPPCPSS